MVIRVARGGFLFALGLYGGVGLAVSLGGPAVFGAIDSRTVAGTAFAALLRRTGTADVCIGVALACLAILWLPRVAASARRTLLAGAVALLLALIGYYTFSIAPRMERLRPSISSFDAPEMNPARVEFDALHHRYVRVYSTNLMVCLVAFGLAVSLGDRPEPTSAPAAD